MEGSARSVVPGIAHHVAQRGNGRQQTFFNDGGHTAYLDRMARWCGKHGVEIWGYCRMPNPDRLLQPALPNWLKSKAPDRPRESQGRLTGTTPPTNDKMRWSTAMTNRNA